MATSLPGRVQIAPDVLFQQVARRSVLLDVKRDLYVGLDDVGTRMWQLLMEPGDPGAVCPQVAAENGSG